MSIDGSDVQNVMHIRSTNAPEIEDTTALGDMADLMDAFYTVVNSFITVDQVYDQVRVQNVTTDVLLGSALWPNLNAGAGAGARQADQVAALITMPTSVPRTRGGVYLGVSPTSAGTSDSSIGAPFLTALANFAAQLVAEQVFGTSSYRYVIYNRLLDTFVLPVSAIVHGVWRTQRRRRQGVGS
jgi:hypothetical protein